MMSIFRLLLAPHRLVNTRDARRVLIEGPAQLGDEALGALVRRLRASLGHDLARLVGVVDQHAGHEQVVVEWLPAADLLEVGADRKSTRLNSSHVSISY